MGHWSVRLFGVLSLSAAFLLVVAASSPAQQATLVSLHQSQSPSRAASFEPLAKDLQPATDATDSIDGKVAGLKETQPPE